MRTHFQKATTNKLLKWPVVILLGFMFSCGSSDEDPRGEFDGASYITSATFLETTSSSTLQAIAGTIPGFSSLTNSISFHDVDAYKITYQTKSVTGETISASGLLMHPLNDNSPPLLSYQHGTLYSTQDSPSNFNASTSEVLITLVMAGAGYAVILPDYIGYGESSSELHPYEHGESLASASFDMLMASKEFFESRNISLAQELFITGYSEGGYATMALHEYIEANSNLTVTMSAPAAGAYNKTAFTQSIIASNNELSFLTNYLWVLDTYNRVYNLNRPWSEYVIEPYATALNNVSNSMLIEDVDVALNPQVLFQQIFRNDILTGADLDFLTALTDNDRFSWTPKGPITLYHGSEDDFVLPLNSRTAYDALMANGADVTLIEFEGKDHGSAVPEYLVSVFSLFENLKN